MIARWSGTFMGIAGALLVASNVEASKYGFPLFLVASALWGIAAYCTKDNALLLLQIVFFSIDSYGIYRWFMWFESYSWHFSTDSDWRLIILELRKFIIPNELKHTDASTRSSWFSVVISTPLAPIFTACYLSSWIIKSLTAYMNSSTPLDNSTWPIISYPSSSSRYSFTKLSFNDYIY